MAKRHRRRNARVVRLTPLSERIRSMRSNALYVLADLRRDAKLTLTQAARKSGNQPAFNSEYSMSHFVWRI